MALNYGSRQEILKAASQWALSCKGRNIEPGLEAAEEFFHSFLMTADIPDPDILIRTSGEQRVSNFLLWQCAYAELVFTPTLWPDFSKADLEAALLEFASRERRFGALSQKG